MKRNGKEWSDTSIGTRSTSANEAVETKGLNFMTMKEHGVKTRVRDGLSVAGDRGRSWRVRVEVR
jgi:hypothetical protein